MVRQCSIVTNIMNKHMMTDRTGMLPDIVIHHGGDISLVMFIVITWAGEGAKRNCTRTATRFYLRRALLRALFVGVNNPPPQNLSSSPLPFDAQTRGERVMYLSTLAAMAINMSDKRHLSAAHVVIERRQQ